MSTVMTRPETDAAKAEAFAGRFVTALNSGALGRGASFLPATWRFPWRG